jgi:hypothetical protein
MLVKVVCTPCRTVFGVLVLVGLTADWRLLG